MAISLGGHLILCAIPITTGRVNSGCRPTFFFEILWNRCHYREHLQVDIHFLCLRFGANILSSEIGGFETVKVSGGSALFERASLGAGHFFFLWSSSNRNDIEVHNGPTSASSIPSPHPRNLLQHSRPARYNPCSAIFFPGDARHLTRD